jgi:hypothetical protein
MKQVALKLSRICLLHSLVGLQRPPLRQSQKTARLQERRGVLRQHCELEAPLVHRPAAMMRPSSKEGLPRNAHCELQAARCGVVGAIAAVSSVWLAGSPFERGSWQRSLSVALETDDASTSAATDSQRTTLEQMRDSFGEQETGTQCVHSSANNVMRSHPTADHLSTQCAAAHSVRSSICQSQYAVKI